MSALLSFASIAGTGQVQAPLSGDQEAQQGVIQAQTQVVQENAGQAPPTPSTAWSANIGSGLRILAGIVLMLAVSYCFFVGGHKDHHRMYVSAAAEE